MKAPWVLACSKAKRSFSHKPPRLVRWGFHPSPLGKFFVGLNEDGALCIFSFAKGESATMHLRQWQAKWPATVFDDDHSATAAIMKHVFEKPAVVNVHLVGTPFQVAVWKKIAALQEGKIASYAAIAQSIKNPKAVRAVGTACGANPVPILVPCHRVLASHGGLGGFGGGLPLKQRLLQVEGVI